MDHNDYRTLRADRDALNKRYEQLLDRVQIDNVPAVRAALEDVELALDFNRLGLRAYVEQTAR